MLHFHIQSKQTENEIAFFYENFNTLAKQSKHFSAFRRWRNRFKSEILENITAAAATATFLFCKIIQQKDNYN